MGCGMSVEMYFKLLIIYYKGSTEKSGEIYLSQRLGNKLKSFNEIKGYICEAY